ASLIGEQKLHFCNKRCSFIRALPLAKKTASLINKRNFEKQILDFGMRILDL
ncbi:hypothetical protein D1AOALGA4SA_10558, partial [Olavius algarvensis Delta 1 endosymbiont]